MFVVSFLGCWVRVGAGVGEGKVSIKMKLVKMDGGGEVS
jgi:hypothetical protein